MVSVNFKVIDFDLENNPFINFLSSRYSMSARVNVEHLWKYSNENNLSFFNLSLACLIEGLNKVPQMKRRIVDGSVIEYEYLDAVCPIMDEDNGIYKEMRVVAPQKFDSLLDWYNYLQDRKGRVLDGVDECFCLDMLKRDETNIANFSCIPWVDFDSISNATALGNDIQPLITWGKVDSDYKMTISITVSHIFVNGKELADFYNYSQDNFNSFEL